MIFLLDNYDSFTYNLAQYLGELGADLLVRRNDEITVDEIASLTPEALVISPGPGLPRDSGITLETVRRFAGKVPILGVCLGHQAIGEVFGGKVVAAPSLSTGRPLRFSTTARPSFKAWRGPSWPCDTIPWWSIPSRFQRS